MTNHIAEIDPLLLKELKHKKFIRVIIEFFESPKKEEIKKLRDIGAEINIVFKVSPLASGFASSEQIEQIRRLPYIKKIWLDSKVKIC